MIFHIVFENIELKELEQALQNFIILSYEIENCTKHLSNSRDFFLQNEELDEDRFFREQHKVDSIYSCVTFRQLRNDSEIDLIIEFFKTISNRLKIKGFYSIDFGSHSKNGIIGQCH